MALDRSDWFRKTLLAALGLTTACGPEQGTGDDANTENGSSGVSSSSTTAASITSDGSGSDTSSATSGDSGEPPVQTCEGAEPIMQTGARDRPTGYVRCSDGSIQRMDSVSCADPSPAGAACPEGREGGCAVDEDCTDGDYGRCVLQNIGGLLDGGWCGCTYGCADDADCGDDRVCACGGADEGTEYPAGSRCIPAQCELPEDCATGRCALGSADDGCSISFKTACTTPQDTCVSDDDCPNYGTCFPSSESWQCESIGACGRPLLVDGQPRTAPLAFTDAWIDPSVRPCVAGLDASTRRILADHWAEAARMEHASIASFARFCRQLMQLGAPPALIAETTRAMADETDHARRCFALASAYRGAPLGPGTLDAGEETPSTRAEIIASLIEEACVGETLAAIEAEHAARLSTDPAVTETLQRIATDELRHATLGWRTLQWALADAPPTARVAASRILREAIASARRIALRGTSAVSSALSGHGVLPATTRRTIVTRAIEHVIIPCFAALENRDLQQAREVEIGASPGN
jgi:hypothetical protein